jgi:hypothetical protein
MMELLEAVAGGALWLAAFGLLTFSFRIHVGLSGGASLLAAYPVFFALQVAFAKVLGAAGHLSTTSFRLSYGAIVVLGALVLVRRFKGRLPPSEPESSADDDGADAQFIRGIVLVTIGLVMAGLTLFTLVSPPHIWDVLAYHMPMVASYVQNGSLEAWPTQDLRQVYRVNAGELQILNVALLARSDAWVELPNLLALGVFVVAGLELARKALVRPILAWLVVAVTLTAPQILLGATTAKNDLLFSAVLLCSFYWIIRAGTMEGRRPVLYASLAGLSCGIAAATKVMGLNVVAAVGILALVLVWRRRWPARRILVFGGAFAGSLLVLAGDVYWANLARSAVPVGIAPDEVAFTFGLANLTEAARFYLYELGFKRLVIPQVFEHDFAHFGYLFPLLLLFGIAGGLRQLFQGRYALAALGLAGAVLFVSVIALRLPIRWDQRFMIWMVPTLAIFAGSLVERIHSRYLLALTGAAAAFTIANLFLVLTKEADGLFNRSALHLAGTGVPARYVDVANERYLHMNDGFEVLDAQAAPEDSILYVGSDDSWMYPAWGPRFTRHVEGVANQDHAALAVASRRFRYVVVEDAALPGIRLAVEEQIEPARYRVLVRAEGRVLLVREAMAEDGGPDL